jgi:hypothetical protein
MWAGRPFNASVGLSGNRLRRLPVKRVIVATNEHPFFMPAQKMYLACGFAENRRYPGGPDPAYRMIEYCRNF